MLIVGLGNPGTKYNNTRHNVGFFLLDRLATDLDGQWLMDKKSNSVIIKHTQCILVKPQTFMNTSGEAVSKIINYYSQDSNNLYVAHDDLDLVLGEYKIQKGKGPKVHGGINSIEERLGAKDFWRIRIGVDNRDPDNRIKGEEYVLQKFSKEEKEKLEPVIKKIASELTSLIK